MVDATPRLAKLVTLIVGRLLTRREKQNLLNKMNMVIGAFFSELGTPLLARLLPAMRDDGWYAAAIDASPGEHAYAIVEDGVWLTDNNEPMTGVHDGREYKATKVHTDPKADLAVLRIEGADHLTAAKLGNSDEAQVGERDRILDERVGTAHDAAAA